MNIRQWLSAAMIGLVFASPIGVANAVDRTGYAGLGIGDSSLDRSGFDNDTGYKAFGGYQYNKNVAFEGAYINLGEFKSGSRKVSIDGFQAAVLGMAPIGKMFQIFGKAGLFDTSGINPTFGVGFEVGQKIAVRVEWEQYIDAAGNSDASMWSVSAVFNFGTGRSK